MSNRPLLASMPERQSLSITSVIAIVLTLATAGIHFSLVPAEFDKGATGYGTLFILAGVGYTAGVTVGYLPWAPFESFQSVGRTVIVGIALGAIASYLVLGYFDTLGWATKAIEVALVVAIIPSLAKG